MKTPIIFLENSKNKIYMKRDDLIPFSFGGNKARKAVNFFQDIDNGDYNCIVTYGSGSSNHCRVISNMAASRRIPCYIISPQETYKPTFNSKMIDLFGAQTVVVPENKVHDTIGFELEKLQTAGEKPYFIPGGGHGNLGTKAYIDCYDEIVNFEKQEEIHFDYIFFASGTGTTQAGLVCGQLLHHDEREIVGISIAREKPRGLPIVIDSIKEYFKANNVVIDNADIENATIFVDNYIGEGYGKADDDVVNVVKEMFINYGIPLDVTYTGKAYSGMLKYIEEKKIKDKNILFIHTGGTPLFFDDLENIL